MRFRPAARALVAGLGLAASGLALTTTQADIFVDSAFVPTSSVVTTGAVLPTSYVLPTATILPSSFVVPATSVVTTGSSVYAPASYTTSYYRGGLFRSRRFVERTSYYDTVGSVFPTSYLSTSPVLSTSYLATSSVLPTAYYSSSAVLPTTYLSSVVPTSAIVPTTILSRSIVTPTAMVVDNSVVPTSASMGVCCAGDASSSNVIVAPSVGDPVPTSVTVPRAGATTNRSLSTSSPVISQQMTGANSAVSPKGAIPSPERQPSAEVNPEPPPAVPAPPAAPKPAANESTSPPTPANQSLIPAPSPVEVPAPGTNAGTGPDTGPLPKSDENLNRTSFKPVYSGVGRPRFRNMLRGRVVSWRTGRPEEGVEVVLAHATGAFRSVPALTAAGGEFSVSLPDGDWSVQVRMPSGSLLAAGQGITATAGQVVDEATGQSVVEYLIRR